jgi:hypothetical protein
MKYSLNEIEVMCKRAARGAGMHWGLAEDVGKAIRWMNAHGLPGDEELANLLRQNNTRRYDELSPISMNGVWSASGGALCPLIAGVSLCDRASEIADGRVIELGTTTHPLLLVPFASIIANLSKTTVKVSWYGAEFVCASGCFQVTDETAVIAPASVESVCCQRTTASISPPTHTWERTEVSAENWAQLNTFAERTFAPATEASRLAGAGAGLSDID